MSVLTLTEGAIDFVERRLKTMKDAKGLRVGIKQAGCSGFSYDINFAKDLPAGDTKEERVIQCGSIKVVVEEKNLPYLQQTVIECVKDDFGEYLKFLNPNVKGECGCGESFIFEEQKGD